METEISHTNMHTPHMSPPPTHTQVNPSPVRSFRTGVPVTHQWFTPLNFWVISAACGRHIHTMPTEQTHTLHTCTHHTHTYYTHARITPTHITHMHASHPHILHTCTHHTHTHYTHAHITPTLVWVLSTICASSRQI